MNPLDIAVIVIIVLSAIFAFARGFVREALSIAAWVGAAAITVYAFNPVLLAVAPIVNNALLAQLIAGFGVFVVSLIVLTIITGFLARMVRSSALSPIDRTLGFIFGLARGVLIVCLAYLALDFFPPADRPPWIKDAKSTPLLQRGADKLRTFLPESWKIKNASLDEAIQALTPAAEAQRAMRALQTPAATTVARPDRSPGYGKNESRQLDRLIDTQR
ncbi:MAG: CvpA family protein [Alphaproteobacteria bacterium]|nr:CvpA family protein [Alphaproteobacteria bacterium]MBV9150611.1 CvpA family protein [Alphaproteobacteria bacterium]MBV9587925.1 CvpA family protein [Alphaproteobacteria bacterium]MBV9965353.1 CvpA family protein [Alphaproteobacteria bacterium]